MLIYSVICILLGYAFSSTSNTSGPGSLSEVIKLFQSLNINRGVENGYHTSVETLPVPKPVLLSAIHNLAPDLLSRAVEDNHLYSQPKESDDLDASIENDNRRFLNWLKKVFGWDDTKGIVLDKNKIYSYGDDKGNSNGNNNGNGYGYDYGFGNHTTTTRPYEYGVATVNILASTKIRKKFKADDNMNDTPRKRRVMDWFKTFFGRTTAVPPTLKLSMENTEYRARQTSSRDNLIMVLTKLNRVIEQLNENLYVQNLNANMTEGYLVLKMPARTNASRYLYRRKRDAVVALTHSNHTRNAFNKTRLQTNRGAKVDTIVRMPSNYEKLNDNNTEHNNVKGSSQEFNNKLVNYLTLAFKEIKHKLLPLNKLKQMYSSEDSYMIGYILANIDILEVNVDKLITELELRKFVGDENKLLELFDKLKASSDVIGNLIRVLKKFNKTNNKFVLQTN